MFGDRFGNPRVPEKSEKFEKKVCGKGKTLSEVWEHGSLLRGGGRGRERGGGGRYPGFDDLSGPWRTVLRREDSPCRRRQRHFER